MTAHKASYWQTAPNHHFTVLLASVLAISYEFLTILGSLNGKLFRNGPELWIRDFLNFFGMNHFMISAFLMLFPLYLSFIYTQKSLFKRVDIYLKMIFESLLLATGLFIFVVFIFSTKIKNLQSLTGNLTSDIGLILGAGLYEEVIFRFVLCGSLFYLLNQVFKTKFITALFTILFSSFLFSVAHFSEIQNIFFQFDFFILRFLTGIIFSLIYIVRGLGITILTHIFYNLLVISIFSR